MTISIHSEDRIYSVKEVAEELSMSERHLRRLVNNNEAVKGFTYKKESERKTLFFKIEESKVEYVNPKNLNAAERISLENAFVEFNGNMSRIAESCKMHYWTVRRYFKSEFKDKEDNRADKGKSRKLSSDVLKVVKPLFEKWYTDNAQRNVKLAIEKVKIQTGHEVPRRLADKWAKALLGTHTMKHYYKEFISKHTPHIRRDLWSEYKNFLDCVVSDVWKIDDFYLNVNGKQATAYCLSFTDIKTRKPISVSICPESVTGNDVKKGMLRVINEFGLPKQWLLDNGAEFINEVTMSFLYGIYFDNPVYENASKNVKVILLKNEEKLINSIPYAPQGKGMQERQFGLFKNEWAVYSKSYSPNQFESRKPDLHLSNVRPEQSFNELAISLDRFISNEYINRERDMFYNPGYTKTHEKNIGRPKTIKEAFETAYSTYERIEIDNFTLAYYYADKRPARYKSGEISFTDSSSKIRLKYIPYDFEKIINLNDQKITCLIDPSNIFHCWILNGKELLCEARDLRYEEGIGITKERANTIGKIRRQVVQLEKKRLGKIEEIEALTPTSVVNTTTGEITGIIENEPLVINTPLHPSQEGINSEFEIEGFTLIKNEATNQYQDLEDLDIDDDLTDLI